MSVDENGEPLRPIGRVRGEPLCWRHIDDHPDDDGFEADIWIGREAVFHDHLTDAEAAFSVDAWGQTDVRIEVASLTHSYARYLPRGGEDGDGAWFCGYPKGRGAVPCTIVEGRVVVGGKQPWEGL